MARTKIPVEFSSTPGIVDNSTVTAITIDSAGSATFSGAVTADGLTTNTAKLKAIAKDISDTAVDVFVYDTRKDSDGGAWRNRTQGTSWYNETLNTSTRGARKEFPSVAVIVAEAAKITIYDGDDPDMPMWMVFANSSGDVYMRQLNTSSIVMLNSQMVWGDASYDVFSVRFVDEQYWMKNNGTTYENGYSGSIVKRNIAGALIAIDSLGIVNRAVNDVAMTVLPNAPIDADTGLPGPTIAVATEGGVSVIKDDGTIVDSSLTVAINSVGFTQNHSLIYNRTDFSSDIGDRTYVQLSIPTSDGFTADQEYSEHSVPRLNRVNNPDLVGMDDDNYAIGSGTYNYGFAHLYNNTTNKADSLFTHITSNYNTGWMHGDIKLATLSQKYTDGLDLVTNGHFDTDTSGWTAVGGAVLSLTSTDEGNRLRLESNGPTSPYAYQQISTVIGETYTVTYDGYYDTVNYKLSVGTTQGGTELTDSPGGLAVDSHTTLTFFATSTTTYLSLYLLGAGEFSYAEFDNISVSLASEIYGTELVTNGTFDTDVSGWTDRSTGTGSVSWNASGYVNLTSVDGSNSGWITQSFATVVGKTYVASITRIANNSILQIGISSGDNTIYQSQNISTDEAATFVATASTTYVSVLNFNYPGTSQVDNISVRLAEEDRSVNGKGLQRFDTIQKVPLLPGSDLVSFNFDQGYLIQPHNSDLNFGTGDFSIIGWAKLNEDTTYANLVIRDEGTGNNQFGVFVRGPAGVGGQENCLGFYLTDSGGSSLQTNPPNVIQVGQWFQYCVVRTGTDVKIYINSKLVGTTTMATDHTSASAVLAIGAATATSNQSTDIEQALLRISATGPTVEQIAKMYNDEKFLFQENAKATLYGTSDAVKALAYDDTTRLLHVGTSSGRSVFQGLRRVDNTTTAVVSTISASNSLIAED